jgi:hypothetical protein
MQKSEEFVAAACETHDNPFTRREGAAGAPMFIGKEHFFALLTQKSGRMPR